MVAALIASDRRTFVECAGGIVGVAFTVLAAICAPTNACGAAHVAAVQNATPGRVETATGVVRAGVPAAPARADFLTTEDPIYSQFREEIYIRHFFNDERGGVYLDVGAWYPEKNSTTAYLDRVLGWTGIAIDPLPGLADRWKRSRPRAKFFSYFVGDRSGMSLPFYLGYGVSSYDEEHVRALSKMGDQRPKKVDVETITLDDLLAREGVESIDFMSMDIEGGEPKALAGFDIDRFKPRLVCIEAGRPETKRRRLIAAYFDAHGYRRITEYEAPSSDPNWYLTPRSAE